MSGPQQPEAAQPRKSPCASCPYRKNVPSGVWDKAEYAKLPAYDGEMHEQSSAAVFMCHQGDGCVCSGWLGHRDPADMLAVRLGLMRGDLDPSCADYTTDVPLFASGAEAAEHGGKQIHSPGADAVAVIDKIMRKKEVQAFHA
ncbi:DUF6283 family protein [Arthrobacter caoxuetaonis]|uniref:DUF6283 family protein n=1 Tax=Arthrobacter caoxuetaonis TaxID=2886935 RepID=A0A9X1MI52_9MICC|nr:DUF6283 family protein [Arthrobacter caoxuetaonis]MCC3299690.1 DUF6283 family protein [Arthrobacter caoxuetaonis]USQ58969.1 DUF6283 family protein [Arthrobacter caoxuetaonis]